MNDTQKGDYRAMKEIEFIRWLSLYDRSRQRLTSEEGRILSFVVQYEAYIEEGWCAIVRYDTAHGYFHRDMMYPDGCTRKKRLSGVSYAEAFTQAELDIKMNWRRYRETYFKEMTK